MGFRAKNLLAVSLSVRAHKFTESIFLDRAG